MSCRIDAISRLPPTQAIEAEQLHTRLRRTATQLGHERPEYDGVP
jgi:hypothetical protein